MKPDDLVIKQHIKAVKDSLVRYDDQADGIIEMALLASYGLLSETTPYDYDKLSDNGQSLYTMIAVTISLRIYNQSDETVAPKMPAFLYTLSKTLSRDKGRETDEVTESKEDVS